MGLYFNTDSLTPSKGSGGGVNNQDITITENGEYSAGEGYTGIGTATVALPLGAKAITANDTYIALDEGLQGYSSVTVNVPNPSTGTLSITSNGIYNVTQYAEADVNVPEANIVTATNTTSSPVTSGDKVFIEKVAGGWNIKNLLDVEGFSQNSTTIDANHVASNFGSTGITCTKVFDFSKPWVFKTHVLYDSNWTAGNSVIYSGNEASSAGMDNAGFVFLVKNPSVKFFQVNLITANETLYLGDSSYTPIDQTQYWFEFGWTGTQYYCNISTDGVNYTRYATIDSTVPCVQSGSGFVLGKLLWVNDMYWRGSIYLNDTSMTVDGSVVWKPYLSAFYEDAVVFTGIANENIAIDETGEVKTALPEPITVIVTSNADNAEISVE